MNLLVCVRPAAGIAPTSGWRAPIASPPAPWLLLGTVHIAGGGVHIAVGCVLHMQDSPEVAQSVLEGGMKVHFSDMKHMYVSTLAHEP